MQFQTNRSMIKVILLSLITCGIYGIWFYAKLADDINLIASRRDGKRTMNYWLLIFIVSPITCGIGSIVWANNIAGRIGDEARARGFITTFGSSTFWLWNVLGSFLCAIGPFVYLHKLCKTMNDICADYNAKGI